MSQKKKNICKLWLTSPQCSVKAYSWGIYPNLSKTVEGYCGSNLILGECKEKIWLRAVLVSLLIADSSEVHHVSATVYSIFLFCFITSPSLFSALITSNINRVSYNRGTFPSRKLVFAYFASCETRTINETSDKPHQHMLPVNKSQVRGRCCMHSFGQTKVLLQSIFDDIPRRVYHLLFFLNYLSCFGICLLSMSCSDVLCILSLSDRLSSVSRSTSPVRRTGLPWRHTEVGIWTPIPEDLWLPSALLRAAGLGPTPVSLQGVNYLSTTELDHSVVVQTISKFPITYLSADSVGSNSHLKYLYNIECNIILPTMSLCPT